MTNGHLSKGSQSLKDAAKFGSYHLSVWMAVLILIYYETSVSPRGHPPTLNKCIILGRPACSLPAVNFQREAAVEAFHQL